MCEIEDMNKWLIAQIGHDGYVVFHNCFISINVDLENVNQTKSIYYKHLLQRKREIQG